MGNIRRKMWGGIIEYEDDDISFSVKYFNVAGKNLPLWLEQSKALHFAAELLMEDARSDRSLVNAPIALMLGGYALEVLLKMVIIGDYCGRHGIKLDSLDAKEFLPRTHDLAKLAELSTLRTNIKDRNVLVALSRYAIWSGRYPIPMNATGYTGPAVFDNINYKVSAHPLWSQYVPLYKKLYRLAVRKVF